MNAFTYLSNRYNAITCQAQQLIRFVLCAVLLLALGMADAIAQKNYIFRVQPEYVDTISGHIGEMGGAVRHVLSLDSEYLICANGPSRVKAQVRRLEGVLGAADDIEFQGIDPSMPTVLGADIFQQSPEKTVDDDFYYELQWSHAALKTSGAWEKANGQGVRIAVLDNGIDANHPDLNDNLNAELSRSFVPGEAWRVNSGFEFHHGTHIAGIIGAANNGTGIIGIAPESELVALKVLSENTGSGDFSWLMRAIVYAADNGVDIANMSLGAVLPTIGTVGQNTHELKIMFDRVGEYANNRGMLLIASLGGKGVDLNTGYMHLPSGADKFQAVSATTPVGWLVDPYTSFFNKSTYANFGAGMVDFVAPGGDASYPGEESCNLSGLERPCWVFDFVFSTIGDGWGWGTSTGIAAAHASGVAALVKSLHPGASPDDVTYAMRASASKIGASPGKDEVFGKGHLNALGALSIRVDTREESENVPTYTLAREEIPTSFELTQNYPNPFNPLTTINFHLPEQSQVYVGVFDVMGRQVATLVNQELEAGCYDTYWNGRDESGNTVESGVYMYKIVANNYVDSKVMTFQND